MCSQINFHKMQNQADGFARCDKAPSSPRFLRDRMKVRIDLELLSLGVDADGLTEKKAPYLSITPKTSAVEYELKRAQLECNQFSDHFGVELADLDAAIRALERFSPAYPPKALVAYIRKIFELDDVKEEDLKARLGTLWEKLLPFQRVGVRTAVTRKFFYLADEMVWVCNCVIHAHVTSCLH